MSKKLYSTEKWKNYMRARQAYQLGRTREKRHRLRRAKPFTRSHPHYLPTIQLKVPITFSIRNNPAGTIGFIREFRKLVKANNLSLDLGEVTTITVDAITALIAEILRLEGSRRINGSIPKNEACRDLL